MTEGRRPAAIPKERITGSPKPGSFERAYYAVRNHGDGTGTVVLDWYEMSDGRDYFGSHEFMRAEIETARAVSNYSIGSFQDVSPRGLKLIGAALTRTERVGGEE